MKTTISSPCNKVCTIDGPSRLCLGCGRSIDEIGAWSALSETERLGIMAALPERMARLGLTALTPSG
jgi:uncharacterized protein